MNSGNTKLKICGIRSLEEAEELQNLEIDYLGCIFAKSLRQVTVELASKITYIAHCKKKRTVGVFVNETIENILKIIVRTEIDVIQLHGNETPEYCEEMAKKVRRINEKFNRDVKLWKVFPVKDQLPKIKHYLPHIEYPLFDTKGKHKGGNGIIFDWDILKEMGEKKFILAGGLSPENIEEALKYRPVILDVNSKVEINDRKDSTLVNKIINIVKQ